MACVVIIYDFKLSQQIYILIIVASLILFARVPTSSIVVFDNWLFLRLPVMQRRQEKLKKK